MVEDLKKLLMVRPVWHTKVTTLDTPYKSMARILFFLWSPNICESHLGDSKMAKVVLPGLLIANSRQEVSQ